MMEIDKDRYPTDELIAYIETKKFESFEEAAEFLREDFSSWWDQTGNTVRQYNAKDFCDYDVLRIEFHTGGWSGCESLINAALKHWELSHFLVEWHTGGHWYFELPQGMK